jgi:cytochrome c-type biogenesis protein CcmH
VSGDETLFVFARAEGGPRMPLALVRARAERCPDAFALDDTPGDGAGRQPLVRAGRARRGAHLALGQRDAPAGDLVGTSAVVQPGTRT